nr:MAG TPA: hypothetical protein [Caudoviricetes sp.]
MNSPTYRLLKRASESAIPRARTRPHTRVLAP